MVFKSSPQEDGAVQTIGFVVQPVWASQRESPSLDVNLQFKKPKEPTLSSTEALQEANES